MAQAQTCVRFVVTNGGEILPKITISGHPGSGTTTLVSGLVNHFNWRYLNGGQVFRDEAKLRNMTLEEFGELCVSDTLSLIHI